MDKFIANVVIEVKNGCVYGIYSDEYVKVFLVDHDEQQIVEKVVEKMSSLDNNAFVMLILYLNNKLNE